MGKRKFISLAEYSPELVSEWHPRKNGDLKPENISYGSAKKTWWQCLKGHEWQVTVNARTCGSDCPICSNQRVLPGFNDLATTNPEIALEWHPTLNGNLTPKDVMAGTEKKVWWQCCQNHKWKAGVKSRVRGTGCPYCSNRKVLRGFNDLFTTNPELSSEWHPTLNGKLTPYDVTYGSSKKVWWICEKGHNYQTDIAHRSNGAGCPICCGKKVLVGFNDLATVSPEIAAEWHPTKNGTISPQMVTVSSDKKVWWQCSKGHEWRANVGSRKRGRNCPECSREIKTSFPEQVIFFYISKSATAYNRYMLDSRTEIDVYLPDYKIGIEYDGIYYHSGENAEKREKIKEEKLTKLGITLISVKETESSFNLDTIDNIIYVPMAPNNNELLDMIEALATLISKIAGVSLNIDINISRDRIQIYEQYLAGEKQRSLLIQNPEVASEWHPTKNGKLLPENVTYKSNKRVWWMCSKGHEWEAMISSRIETGCPICSGHTVLPGYNDLATKNPKLAEEWHPTKNSDLKPTDVALNSNKKVWWQCDKGHEWNASVCDRIRGRGCPICSNRKVLLGYNDLATKNPKLAEEWHPDKNGDLKPTDVVYGSHKKVWWICVQGHEWEAVISSRMHGFGCPCCAGQKTITGVNDLATLKPELASEWHPIKNGKLTANMVMPKSNKKAWWLGKCGHEWEADISSRSAGNGCPYCANKKVLAGYNDLSTINPKIASEWHPTKNGNLTPQDVTEGSNKKIWWQCSKGHEWQTTPNNRKNGRICPICRKTAK